MTTATTATAARAAPVRPIVYVACSNTRTVLEIATDSWTLLRRIDVGASPYVIAVDTQNRRLVATLHEDNAVAVVDLATGVVTRLAVDGHAPHGVALSRDGRFAFITTEGAGTERGAIEVLDIAARQSIATLPLGYGAGSITVLHH